MSSLKRERGRELEGGRQTDRHRHRETETQKEREPLIALDLSRGDLGFFVRGTLPGEWKRE